MQWCSGCRCKAADAVVLDAHTTDAAAAETREATRKEDVSSSQAAPLVNGFASNKESLSLHYFDAEERPGESEEEEDEFFDAISESTSLRGELAVLLREDTVEDDLLLEPCHRNSSIKSSGSSAVISSKRRVSVKSEEWGFPGSLNPRQLVAYQEFREELHRRGGTYCEMVYCYKEIEPEPYALCRFLRWANFVPHKVFKFMDEHLDEWRQAKRHNFYPDAGVKCPLSVLLTQFPSLYTGFGKEGMPVCYFYSGSLSIEGIECLTDIDQLPNFIFYTMMYDIKRIYAEAIARHGPLKRLEQITVMNLDGLSPHLVTPRMYDVSQKVDSVAQIFPEMMHKLILINAPGFFTLIWRTIKVLLDPNTTKRIEIYSNTEKGIARLKELIDVTELPSDYGGLAPSTSERILREGRKGPVPRRQIVELMNVKRRREAEIEFELARDEKISIEIFTRSTSTIEFSLLNEEEEVIKQLDVKSPGTVPYSVHFAATTGPGVFSVTGRHSEGSSSHDHFLVVGEIFGIDTV